MSCFCSAQLLEHYFRCKANNQTLEKNRKFNLEVKKIFINYKNRAAKE